MSPFNSSSGPTVSTQEAVQQYVPSLAGYVLFPILMEACGGLSPVWTRPDGLGVGLETAVTPGALGDSGELVLPDEFACEFEHPIMPTKLNAISNQMKPLLIGTPSFLNCDAGKRGDVAGN
ncbi:hypothetical protein [Cohnella sp. AR92]|uniref:hypothetical protein n=1 Tax=Cohnella sp. AR92 TaxID=648716 RepID=UPI0018646103|nr:hypothetical protein [Cohnella sp. AR92]